MAVPPHLSRSFKAAGLLSLLSAQVCSAQVAEPRARNLVAEQAGAARLIIVQGVQQAIESLPPTAGQSVLWTGEVGSDTPRRSQVLGPTVLRATETIGKGHLTLRAATSYFEMAESLGPITYAVASSGAMPSFAKLGVAVDARVGLLSLSGVYGVTDWLDVTANIPIVVVDADAETVFSTPRASVQTPSLEAPLGQAATPEDLERQLNTGELVLRREKFGDLGFNFASSDDSVAHIFNYGRHIGIGRISVGAKALLYSRRYFQLALVPELFFPSPHEERFAGSNTTAFLPRLAIALPVHEAIKIRGDLGYEHDIDRSALSRVAWSFGISVPIPRVTLDFGLAGSQYDQGIKWTPGHASTVQGVSLTALENNFLGDTFLDVIFGFKTALGPNTMLSGGVTVPITDEGFRPAAIGTLAVEQYF